MATIKSIEEKAKRYDEALKWMEGIYPTLTHEQQMEAEAFFPKLKESEDERMWKLINKYAHYNISDMALEADHITREQLETWLEKQGEHAKFRNSIQVGDKVTRNENGVLVNLSQLKRVAKQEKLTEFEKAVKQVMEEAIECGDTHNLKADAEMLLSLVHKSAWSEDDEELLDKVIKRLHKYSAEDEEYFDKYYWLIELKHRVQSQSTWKPSDERMSY